MSEPTGLEKIRTWIEGKRSAVGCGCHICKTEIVDSALHTLAALAEAVTVIDSECLPGEIDACFERLLDILNGKREEADDGR